MLIPRDSEADFRKLDSLYGVVAVVGPRQAGKTTFLREQMAKGMDVAYVGLDDPSAKALFDADVKKFEQQYLAKGRVTIIDEAQYGRDAGMKLKYLADAGYKMWVSASSQALLEAGVLSYLAGRVGIITLYNFGLGEFLLAKGQKAYTAGILQRQVWEHAVYGGYPAAVLAESLEDKKIMLKNLFTTALLKDTFMAFGIDDQEKLERLAKYLAANIGTEINYGSISKKLGISTPTVQKYMGALEKSYLITRVRPYFTNKGLELAKQPKLYFSDTGMRNAVMDAFPNELEGEGRVFENYVLNELQKAGFTPQYWKSKSKAEVDFIVRKGGEVIPVEAKVYSGQKIEKSLRSFIEKYRPKKALIVVYKGEAAESMLNSCKVLTITADEIRARLG